MTSKDFRKDPRFLRNEFEGSGKYGFAKIKKQIANVDYSKLLACSDTKSNESETYMNYGVHFFVDDFRFRGIYDHPETTLKKYSQYAFLLTPDFSLYREMAPWRQIESVAMNRWIGAYWQSKGLIVVPTISWADRGSLEFCFNSIERGTIVAIGMIGCKHCKSSFMTGYNEMLRQIKPTAVVCFGVPFPEMKGDIITVNYIDSRRKVR